MRTLQNVVRLVLITGFIGLAATKLLDPTHARSATWAGIRASGAMLELAAGLSLLVFWRDRWPGVAAMVVAVTFCGAALISIPFPQLAASCGCLGAGVRGVGPRLLAAGMLLGVAVGQRTLERVGSEVEIGGRGLSKIDERVA